MFEFPAICSLFESDNYSEDVIVILGLDQILPEMFPPFLGADLSTPDLTPFNQLNWTSEEWAEIRLNLSQSYYDAVSYVRTCT